MFALALDHFVTIRRRTAQFCFRVLMCCLFLDFPFASLPMVVRFPRVHG